ncbi:MAG: hypothetical protein IID33_03730 [Planctomycetes bacterium]|nr:hypothetical protein [Planctomycetota bacterium]
MSWHERDYHKAGYVTNEQRGLRGWLPPPVSLGLIVGHTVAFCVLLVSSAQSGAALVLWSENLHIAALLAHPFATSHPLGLSLTVFGIWIVAGRIEGRYGWSRVLLLYVAGNVAAGLSFAAYARLLPDGGMFALTIPVGGLAACCGAAWFGLSDEYVSVFGRLTSVARAAAIGCAIAVGCVLLLESSACAAWITAVIVGGASGMLVQAWGPTLSFPIRRARVRPKTKPAPVRPIRRPTGIDVILDKIARDGIGSLTVKERAQLDAARQTMLDREQ